MVRRRGNGIRHAHIAVVSYLPQLPRAIASSALRARRKQERLAGLSVLEQTQQHGRRFPSTVALRSCCAVHPCDRMTRRCDVDHAVRLEVHDEERVHLAEQKVVDLDEVAAHTRSAWFFTKVAQL